MQLKEVVECERGREEVDNSDDTRTKIVFELFNLFEGMEQLGVNEETVGPFLDRRTSIGLAVHR